MFMCSAWGTHGRHKRGTKVTGHVAGVLAGVGGVPTGPPGGASRLAGQSTLLLLG